MFWNRFRKRPLLPLENLAYDLWGEDPPGDLTAHHIMAEPLAV